MRRSAEWYREVLDAMTDLVLVKGDRSRLLWANRAFLEYYGMTEQELENIVDSPHSDRDDTVQYVKDDHRVFTTGEVLDIPSEPITNAAGRVSYFHTIKAPILDDRGSVVRTLGVSRLIEDEDVVAVSEQERQERKLQLNELRTFVYGIPLAVAMFDVKLRFLSHSRAWQELFEHDGTPLEGEFYDRHFESCIELSRPMSEAIEGREVRREGVALRSRQGREYIVDVEIRPWSFPTGEVGGVITLLHDVTEATLARRELQRVNEELLQFNYRVSHDLLAPLKTVRGFIDLCDDELAEGNLEEVRGYHQIIRLNVVQLGALVEDVLNLARADVRSVEQVDIDLSALVAEILAKFRTDIEAARIEVTTECEGITLRSQRVRVLQVVENLISNGIKYHHPERAPRTMRVAARVDKGDVVLIVEDNGIGFDPSLSEKIFEIFSRGTSKHPGSGLGLYIVSKHIERMKGSIAVLSSRDDTAFEVRIPRGSALGQEPRS